MDRGIQNSAIKETSQADIKLLPLLEMHDERERLLETLVQEVLSPVVRKGIVRLLGHSSNFGYDSQDVEDVYSQSISALLKRISLLLSDPNRFSISNVEALASVVTQRTCIDYLRHRYPQRWRLRDQLRYVLLKQPSFAIWKSEDEDWLCGYRDWTGQKVSKNAGKALEKLSHKPQLLEHSGITTQELQSVGLVRLVAAIFNQVGNPIIFNDLVKLISVWRGLKNQTDQLNEEHLNIATPANNWFSVGADTHIYLQQVWKEIELLAVPQRCALLLNLRYDGQHGLISMFVLLSIATFGDISKSLGVSKEKLVEIWATLPWDDNQIAVFLGNERQHVINLRRSARRSLMERLQHK